MSAPAADDMQDWPDLLRRLALALGRECVVELASRFGGIPVYVPLRFSARHLWSQVVSEKDWPKVVAVCGGERLCLPRGVGFRKREILNMAERGVRARDIALALGITQRHVFRTIADLNLAPGAASKGVSRGAKS